MNVEILGSTTTETLAGALIVTVYVPGTTSFFTRRVTVTGAFRQGILIEVS
jgi:hypothetical protein